MKTTHKTIIIFGIVLNILVLSCMAFVIYTNIVMKIIGVIASVAVIGIVIMALFYKIRDTVQEIDDEKRLERDRDRKRRHYDNRVELYETRKERKQENRLPDDLW